MQFSILPGVLLLATLSEAWKFTATYADGGMQDYSGHMNSHCKQFKKTDSEIISVSFEDSLSADKFELFDDDNCKQRTFKGKKGNNAVPHRKYKSYKVY